MEARELPGVSINVTSGKWGEGGSSIGPGVDSYYEYLVKSYVAMGCSACLTQFTRLYRVVMQYMDQEDWILDVEIDSKRVASGIISSLSAFWPGLEVIYGDIPNAIRHFAQFYSIWSRYGALPDVFTLYDMDLMHFGRGYHLRPELIESNFYLYQATNHPLFLKIAHEFISDLSNFTQVKCGFASLLDVKIKDKHADMMETFFLSETLKYLFLTFKYAEEKHYNEAKLLGNVLNVSINELEKGVNTEKFVLTTEGHFIPNLSHKRLFDVYIPSLMTEKDDKMCRFHSKTDINRLINLHYLPEIHTSHVSKQRSSRYIKRPSVLSHSQPPSSSISLVKVLIEDRNVLLALSKAEFGREFPEQAVLVRAEPENACGEMEGNVEGKVGGR